MSLMNFISSINYQSVKKRSGLPFDLPGMQTLFLDLIPGATFIPVDDLESVMVFDGRVIDRDPDPAYDIIRKRFNDFRKQQQSEIEKADQQKQRSFNTFQ